MCALRIFTTVAKWIVAWYFQRRQATAWKRICIRKDREWGEETIYACAFHSGAPILLSDQLLSPKIKLFMIVLKPPY